MILTECRTRISPFAPRRGPRRSASLENFSAEKLRPSNIKIFYREEAYIIFKKHNFFKHTLKVRWDIAVSVGRPDTSSISDFLNSK